MKKLPEDVTWALAVQHSNTPISVDQYNKLLKIVEENPQHFKWEHKYWSIPDEVHEAYHKDVSEMRKKVMPEPPLHEIQKEEYERKKHKLWKKHYGPYKLKYR